MNSSQNLSTIGDPDDLGSPRILSAKPKNRRSGNGSAALGLDLGVERFLSELLGRVSPLRAGHEGGVRASCGGAHHSYQDNASKQPLLIKVGVRIKICLVEAMHVQHILDGAKDRIGCSLYFGLSTLMYKHKLQHHRTLYSCPMLHPI